MGEIFQRSFVAVRAVYSTIFILALVSPITADWCYTELPCGPATWGSMGFCNGSRQSPVNIVDGSVQLNSSLGAFTFINYSDTSKILALNNPGHTVEVLLDKGMTLSGGGLPSTYSAYAFHFHWGNGTLPGSEHRLGGQQFPMEMHIVHLKEGMSVAEAKNDSTGIAALGFFIDVGTSANMSQLTDLVNLLPNVSNPGTRVNISSNFSIDTILGNVDRTSYYRYLGSLTTPTCDESVIWTVFKNPILVPASVIQAFSSSLVSNISVTNSFVTNNFRPLQALNGRIVQSSFMVNSSSTPSTTPIP
ncbi:hypothetical protein GDO86_017598, partial [Hymenochirus boettgeri]